MKKKQEMELRFYEMPQGERVLALIGPTWIREYGNDMSVLHFHNLMEIGYCIDGEGKVEYDEDSLPYGPGVLTVIPKNYPHTTKSVPNTKSYWEYLFFDPIDILRESYPDDSLFVEKMEKLVNQNAHYYYAGENDKLVELVRLIMEEYRDRKSFSGEYIKGLLLALVVAIARENDGSDTILGGSKTEDFSPKSGLYHISSALEYISKRYMENIRLETLAACCSLSESHFRRIFVENMNMTPVEYVNLVRIQQACELMKTTHHSMEEIAARVGYTTASTFNRNFKKIVGTSPYQYKKNSDDYQGKLLNIKVSAKKGW
jgi:AraC-like DNA-binding protein